MALLKGRSLLSMAEFTAEEITKIIDLADSLKRRSSPGTTLSLLEGRSLAAIFEKTSTRTRVSLEVAMHELGGQAIILPTTEIQLARGEKTGETVEDTAKVLSQYVDAIAARVNNHETVKRLAMAAEVPVINALSDLYHPLQTLGDLQTVREVKGRLKGVKLAWIGDGTNVCNSLLIGGAEVGLDIRVASPPGYRPHREAVDMALKAGKASGGSLQIVEDPVEAARDCDIVYTDTFVSIGKEAEREARLKIFLPRYQVNPQLMEKAKPDAVFLHCLPAHRLEETVPEVIDGPQSKVWQQAANRLHVTKALLCFLLLDENQLRTELAS